MEYFYNICVVREKKYKTNLFIRLFCTIAATRAAFGFLQNQRKSRIMMIPPSTQKQLLFILHAQRTCMTFIFYY